LDWCVKDHAQANHPPVARLRGELRRTAKAGQKIELDASDSSDPDGHKLQFEWAYYPEPGSYHGPAITIQNAATSRATFVAPKVSATETIHIILVVTDEGSPPLTRYQRLVITVTSDADIGR
jgi:hypothetical protein